MGFETRGTFDEGKRLIWMTTFENDRDPYVEDDDMTERDV